MYTKELFYALSSTPLPRIPARPGRGAPVARIAIASAYTRLFHQVADSAPADVVYRNSFRMAPFSLQLLVELEHRTLLVGAVDIASTASAGRELGVLAGRRCREDGG